MLSIYKILYLLPCKAMEHLLYVTHYVDDILFWETIKAIICIGLSMESIVLKFLCIWKTEHCSLFWQEIAKRLPRPPAS
jgi:hypothetical protein